MTDMPLLDWQPPEPFHAHGETFIQSRDGKRLKDQCLRVYNVMRSGHWQTLASISQVCGDPEASCSARLRQLRTDFGFVIERAYAGNGLHKYRLVK